MSNLSQAIKSFLQDESGLTVVEYAVAGGLITAAVVASFTTIGDTTVQLLSDLITALGATPPS